MKLDYESLVKEGYIEAGTLVIQVDDITKLQLTSEEVKPEDSIQTRQDKGVVVIDKYGRMKKVSSLMFGYNKKGVELADGNFANADELLAAMQQAIGSLDKGTIIVDKKGKVLNPEELLQVVMETSGKIKIGNRAIGVTNQDSRYWSVTGANSDIEHNKGVVFLGNDKIELKSGEYVSVEELLAALNDYMIMKPKEVVVEQTLKPQERKVVRVVHKYKDRLSRWLVLLSALLVLGSGFSLKDNVQAIEVPVEVQQQIMQIVEADQLNYGIDGYDLTYETLEQARKRIISEKTIGQEVYLEQGDTLYSNSHLTGSKAIIGNGLRQEGNYQISGVSIVCNGHIYDYHVDLSIKNPGFEIGDFINKVCEENNLDLNQVQVRVHFGNSQNHTTTGWISLDKLIKEENIEKQLVTEKTSTYDGVVEDFNGPTITINTLEGATTIKVTDENGNLLAPGSTVIGSDGKQYVITALSVTKTQVEKNVIVTETQMEQRQVVDGKKLSWSIQDCNLLIGIAPLLGAIASTVITKKKNDELEKEPTFFEFENEEQYQKFKREFEEAKQKYEKQSSFSKMLKNLFYRKETDILQNLTEEQIQQLYSAIKSNYAHSENDRVEFKNGRIIVTNQDGKTQDITDEVMPAIASIGKDNKVVTEGLLEEGAIKK